MCAYAFLYVQNTSMYTHRNYTEWPEKKKSMYTVMQYNSTVINTNFVKLLKKNLTALYQRGCYYTNYIMKRFVLHILVCR